MGQWAEHAGLTRRVGVHDSSFPDRRTSRVTLRFIPPHVFLTELGLRLVALAARRNASNNLRWRGCRSKRNSGCHWMPRKKRWFGDSIASTIPSEARALAINEGATALTD